MATKYSWPPSVAPLELVMSLGFFNLLGSRVVRCEGGSGTFRDNKGETYKAEPNSSRSLQVEDGDNVIGETYSFGPDLKIQLVEVVSTIHKHVGIEGAVSVQVDPVLAAGSGKLNSKMTNSKTAGTESYTVEVNRAIVRLKTREPIQEKGCKCSLIICEVTLGVKLAYVVARESGAVSQSVAASAHASVAPFGGLGAGTAGSYNADTGPHKSAVDSTAELSALEAFRNHMKKEATSTCSCWKQPITKDQLERATDAFVAEAGAGPDLWSVLRVEVAYSNPDADNLMKQIDKTIVDEKYVKLTGLLEKFEEQYSCFDSSRVAGLQRKKADLLKKANDDIEGMLAKGNLDELPAIKDRIWHYGLDDPCRDLAVILSKVENWDKVDNEINSLIANWDQAEMEACLGHALLRGIQNGQQIVYLREKAAAAEAAAATAAAEKAAAEKAAEKAAAAAAEKAAAKKAAAAKAAAEKAAAAAAEKAAAGNEAKQHIDAFVARMETDGERKKLNDSDIKLFLDKVGAAAQQLTQIRLHSPKVTDAGIEALAKNCTSMTVISLYGCDTVTDGGIKALAQNGHSLSIVKLNYTQVTDAGIEALAKNCPSLTTINLRQCGQVTDAGIEALAKNCPSLTTINLRQCGKVTDEGIKALAQNCHSLTNVDLTMVAKVTDAGIEALAKSCTSLKNINLECCAKVTDGMKQMLRDKGIKGV